MCGSEFFNWMITKYLQEDEKLYIIFMYLGKVSDRVDVLKIYGVRGQLLEEIAAFYSDVGACVRVEGGA